MADEADGIWLQALQELRLQMVRATFDTWLASSRAVELAGDELVVAVPNAYALDWLNHRLMGTIRRTVQRQAGRELRISFVVAPGASGRGPDASQGEGASEGAEEALRTGFDQGEVLVEAVREEHVTAGRGSSLAWTDFYIKLKVAFRRRGLRELQGAPLSVFLCLALHLDRDGVAYPGIDTIMSETGYARASVCRALDKLQSLGIVSKRATFRGADEYVVNGYAWFGQQPAPAMWEE